MNKPKKILTLKDRRAFLRLYRKGKCISGHCMVVYCLKNKTPLTHLGITVSKKTGNAVVRNGIKRRIRESFRLMLPAIKDGYDIVVVARQSCVNAHFTVIQNELHGLLKEATLLEDDE